MSTQAGGGGMRVGVVLDLADSSVGGGHTFANSVLDGLSQTETRHSLFLFSKGNLLQQMGGSVSGPLIDLHARTAPSSPVSERLRPAMRSLVQRAQLEGAVSAARRIAQSHRILGYVIPQAAIERAARDLSLDVVWFADQVSEVTSVPFFATVWDLEHRRQPYFPEVSVSGWRWEAREEHYSRTLPRAARIFTGTRAGKDEIVHYYRVNPANVVVNPFAVPALNGGAEGKDASAILAAYGLSTGFLLYPAQFWPHKNHVGLLRALRILESEHGLRPDLVLTGSDKGNGDYVRSVISELGLTDRVHILGFVPATDLEALYREASLLAFPTFFGPDNIPPLEAFALGCPVVASDVPGAREQLGDAALLFNPARPDELAAQIAAILGSADLRDRLVERGRGAVASRTPRNYVEAVMRALDEFEPIRRNWRNDYAYT